MDAGRFGEPQQPRHHQKAAYLAQGQLNRVRLLIERAVWEGRDKRMHNEKRLLTIMQVLQESDPETCPMFAYGTEADKAPHNTGTLTRN